MRRTVQITPHKQRAAGGIRKLAATVHQTFPDLVAHQHLQDAAREADAGRYDGAKRHLDAAISSFTPQNLHRNGIWDDVGHTHAKQFMHEAHRHLLLVKDLEDIGAGNQMNADERRERAQGEKAGPQPDPAGKTGLSNATSWESVMHAIELAVKPTSMAGRRALAKQGKAMPDKSFPMPNPDYVHRAEKMVGLTSPAKRARVKALIAKRKRELGMQQHASEWPGIELATPGRVYRYKHGWVKLQNGVIKAVTQNNPAYTPDQPGFGQISPAQHARMAKAHMSAAGKAPQGSSKQQKHMKMARMHALAARGGKAMRNARPAWNPDMPGFGMASDQNGIELVGPKGYSHGWVYHGPGEKASPSNDPSGTHTGMYRTGSASAGYQWFNPHPSKPDSTPGQGYKPVGDPSVARLDGKQVHGARADGKGAVVGKLNHSRGTVTEDRSGQEVPVTHVDPTWNDYGFKGLEGSHLPPDIQNAIRNYKPMPLAAQRKYDAHDKDMINFIRQHNPGFASRAGGIELAARQPYHREPDETVECPYCHKYDSADARYCDQCGRELPDSAFTMAVEMSAKTGALAATPHPFGKPGGPGLWHTKGMELPPYIQNIARALLRTGRAKDLSQAIAIAKGATSRWARGGGHVHPEVRAASAATNADWEAKRARAHAHANQPGQAIELDWTAWDQQHAAAGHTRKGTAADKHFSHLAHLQHLLRLGRATPAQKAELKMKLGQLSKSGRMVNPKPTAPKVNPARIKTPPAA